MIKPPLISLIYLTLKVSFQIMLRLMKPEDFKALLNIQHINLQQHHNLYH